ncbi:MAG: putative metal-binding motif-containing protein [Deltaproteobacteria bacterium]|nr:putative metal-binding motif-containing protein [Deltaproteobacteria bacterium]
MTTRAMAALAWLVPAMIGCGDLRLTGPLPDAGPDLGADADGEGDDAAAEAIDDGGDAEGGGCRVPSDCDDGLRCNGFEQCVGGSCTAGAAPECEDGLACTDDTCLEAPPYCGFEPHDERCPDGWRCGPDGCEGDCGTSADCDDGEPCNGTETCRGGLCLAGVPMDCADPWPCTVDGCLAGRCYSYPDHSLCPVVGQLCNPERGCIDVGPCTTDEDCDDGDPCNGVEDCTFGLCTISGPMPCDVGDWCTGEELCIDGACVAGPPPRCDDGDPCNGVETCGGRECLPGAPPACDDGLFCNGAEVCGAGGCRPGTSPCDDRTACTLDECDEASRSCRHAVLDADGDGFGAAACGGEDCDDERGWVHPGAPESCLGGVDEDCDGLTDCEEPACAALPECCRPAPEDCNGRDDDCDTAPDDGLTCFVTDGTVIQPFVTGECAEEFYQLGTPLAASANLDPDVTVSDAVVVLVHETPTLGCPGRWNLVVVADRAGDGTGGTLRMDFYSDPITETGVTVSDDEGDCVFRPRIGGGRCLWSWDACCTDGMAFGNFDGTFCAYVQFFEHTGVSEVRVLDAAGGYVSRGFDEMITVCRVTHPAVP